VRDDRNVTLVRRPWPCTVALLPRPLRHGMWLSIVVVSALAAATLTVTASGAQTRSPFSPTTPLMPSAGDDTGKEQDDGVSYGFEDPGDLRGWDVGRAARLVDDTAAVHGGERSLGIVVDANAGGRRVDVTASLGELSRPPGFTLADATLTCYVRARGSADDSTLLGTMIAVDREERADHGSRVAIADDRWTALTMVVGAVDEPSADGRPVRQDDGFDDDAVVTFGVRLRAATGELPPAFNIDDCTVQPADAGDAADAKDAGAASDGTVAAPPVAAPVERAPVPAPEPRDDRRSTDGGRGGRERSNGTPDGGGDVDGGGDDEASGEVRYGFEDDPARRGWTAQGATLRVDRRVAHAGGRSLAVVPDRADEDRVAVRARVDDLVPRPRFSLDGARLVCHVRGDPAPDPGSVFAALVAEDGRGGLDAGSVVELTDDWSVVSLVVGEGTQDPDGSFDTDAVVAFAVHVAAASGALPASINVDDCTVARSGATTR
jgi:hypothetical protein